LYVVPFLNFGGPQELVRDVIKIGLFAGGGFWEFVSPFLGVGGGVCVFTPVLNCRLGLYVVFFNGSFFFSFLCLVTPIQQPGALFEAAHMQHDFWSKYLFVGFFFSSTVFFTPLNKSYHLITFPFLPIPPFVFHAQLVCFSYNSCLHLPTPRTRFLRPFFRLPVPFFVFDDPDFFLTSLFPPKEVQFYLAPFPT